MPSPFPGMNPYLENPAIWPDFHESCIPVMRSILSAKLRPRYFVKIEEHIYIHELSADERRPLGRPDVSILPRIPGTGTSTLATSAPVAVEHEMSIEEVRTSYLEVLDSTTREVVTVIELLSPSNKSPGPDRSQYLAKRRRILRSSTHLVEIDLLRSGPRMPDLAVPPCDYLVMVSRADQRPKGGCWPIGLRDELPLIPIPLRIGDDEITLNLKECIDRVYDDAGYENEIYRTSPVPPLSAENTAWAESIVSAILPQRV